MPVNRGGEIRILPIPGIPEVAYSDSIACLVVQAGSTAGIRILGGDILVVAQKIVSKAEGRVLNLQGIEPSAWARKWARAGGRDARHLEVILGQSRRIVRENERVIISETLQGWTCANAGVDRSNIPQGDAVSVLPRDADESARRLRVEIEQETGARVAIIVSDTFGRPWRLGLTNVAIGAAGLNVLHDYHGAVDSAGRALTATLVGVADELAAAAGLAMGKIERIPAVVIRGYNFRPGDGQATDLIRPGDQDLFP